MLHFFKNFFLSKEAKETIIVHDEIGSEITRRFEKTYIFEIRSVWCEIDIKIKKSIKLNNKELTEAIKNGKVTPKSYVLNGIIKLSHLNIISGNHHVHRGILSDRGQTFYSILLYALDSLENINFITKDRIKTFLEEVEHDIKYAG